MWLFLLLIHIANVSAYVPYDETEATTALYFAYGAYCDASELTSWTCKWCQNINNFQIASGGVITGDGLQAFIGYDSNNKRITLAFRGTSSSTTTTEIEDWIDNLDYSQDVYPYKTGYIHSGFYNSWKTLGSLGLTSKIQAIFDQYPWSNILITGHSLGASLAQIAALELKNNPTYSSLSIGSISVISFGSPRWCDKTLAIYYNSIIDLNWRIVNEDDIVSTVPYTYMGDNGFYHTAQEIRYTDTDTLTYVTCSASDGEDEGDSGCWYIGYSIPDHLSYLKQSEDCSSDSSGIYIDIDDINDIWMPSTTDMIDMNTDQPLCPCHEMFTSIIDDGISTSNKINNDIMSTTEIVNEDNIVYKVKKQIDNVSKIALSIALGIGWLLCFICSCCYCKTRRDVMNGRRDTYFQLHDV